MSEFLDVLLTSPLPDGMQWCVRNPGGFRYQSDISGLIVVPENFVTDWASVPQMLWWKYPPWQRYGAAALLHDLKYWSQDCTRAMADNILREAMTLLGVADLAVIEIYEAVHLCGQWAWDRNTMLKQSGYTKMAGAGNNPPYSAIPDLPRALA